MRTISVFTLLLLWLPIFAQGNTSAKTVTNGEVWLDTSGNPINAHGGGILYHDGKYYWYGEYKKGKTILPECSHMGMLPHGRV